MTDKTVATMTAASALTGTELMYGDDGAADVKITPTQLRTYSLGTLTQNAVVLGGGAGSAPSVLGSLGTTTTVLHGNASGAPTFGAVNLNADVTGYLPLPVNAQTGTTYTILSSDLGKLVTFSNGSSVAVTLPQATGSFASGASFMVENKGAGTVTITPTTSTVDGGSTLVLLTNQGAVIASDGTNYATMRGGLSGYTFSGTGTVVALATAPSFTTPTLGAATATSINKVAITAPASSATITVADGKTATFNNSITFAGTDSTTMTFPGASASIGYLNVPINSQNAGYTAVLADAGKAILMATAGTFTIPANASVAYPLGTVLTFINGTTSCTIPITSDTMTLAGSATTGTRTLAANGIATAIKTTSTTWIISGTGLT